MQVLQFVMLSICIGKYTIGDITFKNTLLEYKTSKTSFSDVELVVQKRDADLIIALIQLRVL